MLRLPNQERPGGGGRNAGAGRRKKKKKKADQLIRKTRQAGARKHRRVE